MCRMPGILAVQTVSIAKNRRSFFKWDTMLFVIDDRFSNVPREHERVYTIILENQQQSTMFLDWLGLRQA